MTPRRRHQSRPSTDAVDTANRLFAELRLSEIGTLDELVQFAEHERHTSLQVVPLDGLRNTAACGLLVTRDGTCTIYHVPTPSVLHRTQCILHELSHLLLRHDETTRGDAALARFVPDIRLEVGDRIFGRASFDDDTEIAAERLADLLAASIRLRPQPGRFEEFFG